MAEGHQAEQLSEEIKALIRGANFGHLATLMRDGAPHVDPVWIDLEGETIIVCSRYRLAQGQEHKARCAGRIVSRCNGQPVQRGPTPGPGYRAATRSRFNSDRPGLA